MEATNDKKAKSGSWKWYVLAGLVMVVGLGFGVLPTLFSGEREPEAVRGSGSIEGTSVVVSSQLSGLVKEMQVQEGQRLAEGELIAMLGFEELDARVDQARARLELATYQVEQARAVIESARIKSGQATQAVDLADRQSSGQVDQALAAMKVAEANRTQAEVALEQARDDYQRYEGLYQAGAVDAARYTAMESAYRLAVASFDAAREGLEQAKAAVQVAKTTVIQTDIQRKEEQGSKTALTQTEMGMQIALAQQELAKAVVREAEVLLDKSRIYAPVSGTVSNKLVEQGELVAAGSPVVRMVDLENLELTIYIAGRDLGRVKLRQTVQVFVEDYPEQALEGWVSRIAQEAEFTPKKCTYA